MSIPFESPTTMLLASPTQSGETCWVERLINSRAKMFKQVPSTIIYCYGAWQTMFDKMRDVKFHKGLPTLDELEEWSDGHVMLIIDDLMQEACSSKDILSLFTIYCHQKNISVLFLAQNIFPPGKCARTISLNCHYIILFGMRRDKLQVQTLGSLIFPGHRGYFMNAYQDATNKPYGYLVCDVHPSTNKMYQLRTHIFPDDMTCFYTIKGKH